MTGGDVYAEHKITAGCINIALLILTGINANLFTWTQHNYPTHNK